MKRVDGQSVKSSKGLAKPLKSSETGASPEIITQLATPQKQTVYL